MNYKAIFKSLFILVAAVAISIGATGSYFSDQASVVGNQFSTGYWSNVVINEVYYDVDAAHDIEGKNEWIELYNPTPDPINLKNYTIEDNSGITRTIHSNTIIPAFGLAIISKDASTWALYWTMPPLSVKIALGLLIGNGLATDGDRVILKNAAGTIVDQMGYGTDTAIWDPAVLGVAEGHSLERVSPGYDTDLPSDFVEMMTPTPGN